MTLRRAVRTFIRPWTDHGATFKEWILACDVLADYIERDEARKKAAPRSVDGGSHAHNGTGAQRRQGAPPESRADATTNVPTWRDAAKRIGELLASEHPEGYDRFNPHQWATWATATLAARIEDLECNIAELEEAVRTRQTFIDDHCSEDGR